MIDDQRPEIEPDTPSRITHHHPRSTRRRRPSSTGPVNGHLGSWVAKYRVNHAGEEPPLSITDRARLRLLEKENRELKMKAEFLGKAAAFFAQESR
jgi:hypothetical protein